VCYFVTMAKKPTDKKNRILVRLGERLAEARRSKGLSQEEFAHKMGLHSTYAGMLERGERNATITNILRVCSALGIKPGSL